MTTPRQNHAMVRGLRLAYLDFGGTGAPLLALHGHFGRGRQFARLAADLAPRHRVIAVDLRGHGRSDRGVDVTPDAYTADVAEFLRHLDLGPLPVLGHSMGGVIAYRVAARHPELVSALIVEEGGALNRQPEIAHPVLDVRGWARRAPTPAALRREVESHGIPDASYFLASACEYPDGWGFLFDHDDMTASQQELIGDWWPDWLGARCPTLLVHGLASGVLPTAMARDMARRRPGTVLREFADCGHWVHDDDPAGFAEAVRGFLSSAVPTSTL
ncbi:MULTISPECIES: alpha/beta fold hydrolase [Actinoalloteichus]|uniref:Hydrolase or acyltransferase of alpha/beta superfamily n=1 Tax=Actinoalloteichus fjordicus TaxID=1612552 RepID=A0AAC9LCM1_9PSEU|nr:MULTISPECIES: alpha/beta hydrolase [Actinoalloteichus]APU15136.1 putative hydrolase or acyltransferase of alpha/beta superfamily [Actinoalloteichus fjordicus]APU21204.1 putative hydrolase or acyltransferase of alpha/beta superfamily [Actinoalloteichus sp. GBA129-24]